MSDFDYGNARLRVMKSRLLNRRDMDALVGTESVQGLISYLSRTSYHRHIEAALARTSGIACIELALRNDLEATIQAIRGFYSDRALEMLKIILREYDIENLKTVLRGVSKRADPAEIMAGVLPVGELTGSVLTELAQTSEPRVVIDMLATMALPFAEPLLQLRARQPGAGISQMENSLVQWYYRKAFIWLEQEGLKDSLLFETLQLQADLVNLLVVIRLAHAPVERTALRTWMEIDLISQLFVTEGKISHDLLIQAASQEGIEKAVDILTTTRYGSILSDGLVAYRRTYRLSEFEKCLRRYRLNWMAGLIAKDPLGIGVVLGYLALKMNEVINLRWIAYGSEIGLEKSQILAEIIYNP